MTPADVVEVEAANQEYYSAFEAGDLDRMSALWAFDSDAEGQVTCVHPGWPMLRGRAEVLRSWALIMANTTYIQFVLTDVQATVHGDVAMVTCGENVLTAAEGSESEFAAGGSIVASKVFVRTESGWRLWLHHGSPVMERDDDEDDEA